MSEAKLWRTLRNAIGHVGHWDRIESHATSQGRPDVNWCTESCVADIELKIYDVKRGGFILRANQNAWMQQRTRAGVGGNAWIFARFDSVEGPIYLLIPGNRSRALIHERSYEAWHNQAAWVWQGEVDWTIWMNLVRAGTAMDPANPS